MHASVHFSEINKYYYSYVLCNLYTAAAIYLTLQN